MNKKLEDSTFEYIKSQNLWHFDKDSAKIEFKVIGKFIGDWKKDINKIDFHLPKTVDSSMPHTRPNSFFEKIKEGNRKDFIKNYSKGNKTYGISFDELKQPNSFIPEIFKKMKEMIPLKESYIKVTRQFPGQTWPFHFDNYHALRDPNKDSWDDPKIRRIWIALEDWDWGHYASFGNKNWENWKAGDILYFDWLVPHSTANSGISPRHSLFLTGFMTPELTNWIESGEYREIEL